MDAASSSTMDATGERMVPESADSGTFWEHIYRYRFATQFVSQKCVLDIASGEGYGLAALRAAGASAAIGVDISPEAVAHAKRKYGLDVRTGNGEAIPLESNSVDVVTSFETIEHVGSPEAFLKEICRVLKPGGRVVISTPIRETYGVQNPNEFHISELSEEESRSLFSKYFDSIEWWAQRPHSYPCWSGNVSSMDSLMTKTGKICRNFWARASIRLGRNQVLYNVLNWRERPIEAIKINKSFHWPLDPFRIRARNQFSPPGPQYLIAVATNKSK